MNFLSLCSGIDAASVAFTPLGWIAVGFSEIEPYPCAVLAQHYPHVPNYGDMMGYGQWPRTMYASLDAIVGGPPCQAFSVAGARQSLDDARGNLTLTYAKLLNHADTIRTEAGRPAIVGLYENVPGILSTKDNAFGCLLAALVGEDDALVPPGPDPKPGKSWKWPNAGCVVGPQRTVAWRVCDAQYFGLAQRRKRVFVVASARADFDPVAVLFEFHGVRRDTAPSRQAWENAAGPLDARAGNGGFPGSDGACANHVVGTLDASYGRLQGCSGLDINRGCSTLVAFGGNRCSGAINVAAAVNAKGGSGRMGFESETFATHTLTAAGFDASEDGTGRGTPLTVDLLPTMLSGAFTETGHGARSMETKGSYIVPELLAFNSNAQIDQLAPDPYTSSSLTCSQYSAIAFACQGTNVGHSGETFDTLRTSADRASGSAPCVAFQSSQSGVRIDEVHATLDSNNGSRRHNGAFTEMRVRRLTPRECERLQGFPDDYTAIRVRHYKARHVTKLRPVDLWEPAEGGGWWLLAADGPRYKALGNSWAVPCVQWIARRINQELEPLW